MTAEPLFEPPPAIVTLTERQAFVLRCLHAVPDDGLDADEVGARMHERRGKHDAGVRCTWCASDGQGVLKALRKKGLVRRRRGGTWVALSQGEEEAPGKDGVSGASPSESAPDGFPVGF